MEVLADFLSKRILLPHYFIYNDTSSVPIFLLFTGFSRFFVETFFVDAQKVGKELPYEKELLKDTLVKMTQLMHSQSIQKPTNLLTARRYVFSTLLSPEEKITYSQENYITNPDATKNIVRKWSGLVCNELIKLKQLEESAKAHKEQELYQEVMDRFEKSYKK